MGDLSQYHLENGFKYGVFETLAQCIAMIMENAGTSFEQATTMLDLPPEIAGVYREPVQKFDLNGISKLKCFLETKEEKCRYLEKTSSADLDDLRILATAMSYSQELLFYSSYERAVHIVKWYCITAFIEKSSTPFYQAIKVFGMTPEAAHECRAKAEQYMPDHQREMILIFSIAISEGIPFYEVAKDFDFPQEQMDALCSMISSDD